MYKIIATLLSVLFVLQINAQSCSQYLPLTEGYTYDLTSYSKKGKETGKVTYKVLNVSDADNGEQAEVEFVNTDQKGEQTASGSYTMTCTEEGLAIESTAYYPSENLESLEGFEFSMEGDDVFIPNVLSEGMELPDATLNINITAPMVMTFTMTITDRKVIGQETITTPAGTFECWKISQTSILQMGMSFEVQSIEYYAKGVGMVRSESYRNDKLQGYSEITSIGG